MKILKIFNTINVFILIHLCTGCTYNTFNCESSDVKNIVIESFKENSEYYKSIDESSIGSITLMYPRAVDYNKDIGLYSCEGNIIIKATNSSFLPKDFNSSNLYYQYTTNFYNQVIHDTSMVHYNTYMVDVEYKTQISEGNLLVTSWFDNEELSCDNICEQEVAREQMQKQLAREAEEQRNKHVILPD